MDYIPHRDDFDAVVEHFRSTENTTTVLAVYRSMTELITVSRQDPRHNLACAKGCSHCCYQALTILKPEGREIKKYLLSQPALFAKLKARIWESILEWRSYVANNPTRLRDPLQIVKDWAGQPCMFLDRDSGECQIYPVRPFTCRLYGSKTTCTSPLDPNAAPQMYVWATWAYEAILKDDPDADTKVEMMPLQVWAALELKDHL